MLPAIWTAALVFASELTLLSIGFTLIYLTAKVPNFAHGIYAGIGIYVSFTFSRVILLVEPNGLESIWKRLKPNPYFFQVAE